MIALAGLPVLEQIKPDTVLASSRCSEVVLESIKRHCERTGDLQTAVL